MVLKEHPKEVVSGHNPMLKQSESIVKLLRNSANVTCFEVSVLTFRHAG